jgi:membrane-associated phospholipid phosphatase
MKSVQLKPYQSFFAFLSLGIAAVSFVFGSLPVKALDFTLDTNATVVVKWNQTILEAIRDTNMGPTVASRALAIANTSMFDAWAAYDPKAIATQLEDTLQVPPEQITLENKQEAISYAAYTTLVNLFPSKVERFRKLMAELGYDPNNTTTDRKTAAGIGNITAKFLLAFRQKDNSNQLGGYADTTNYQPVNRWDKVLNPNYWQPLQQMEQFLTPHWKSVVPFALTSSSQFLPPPPPAYGSPEYRERVMEIVELSAQLDDRKKAIAEYWAAPTTPAGQWHQIAQFISQRDRHSLDEDAKLFFILGNAVLDAGISAWNAKIYYNYVRPVTAIRFLATRQLLPNNQPYARINPHTGVQEVYAWGGPGQGTQWIDGSQWKPYITTPPFPEYVSGHSTFSAAAAEVLKRFTGSDRFGGQAAIAPHSSSIESNTPQQQVVLDWATFSDAANEAGLSRRYSGIHFRDADLNGRAMGRLVGAQAWEKAQYYINGK